MSLQQLLQLKYGKQLIQNARSQIIRKAKSLKSIYLRLYEIKCNTFFRKKGEYQIKSVAEAGTIHIGLKNLFSFKIKLKEILTHDNNSARNGVR